MRSLSCTSMKPHPGVGADPSLITNPLLSISIAVLCKAPSVVTPHSHTSDGCWQNSRLLDGDWCVRCCGIKPATFFQKQEQCCQPPAHRQTSRYLTRLHALVVLFHSGRSVVGFVDGCPEALVAAPPPDDSGAWPVEREVPVEGDLGNSRLEALERAGLL